MIERIKEISKKLFLAGAILLIVLIQSAPLAQAATDDCSESKLRDLGVMILNCAGDTPESCGTTANGLSATVPEPYKSLFERAAAAYKTNPQFLAALFLSEHANAWPPFNSQWAVSGSGAAGPFQFMPGTWDAHKVDGDNDGKTDINNVSDAAFSAANMLAKSHLATDTKLGDIGTPFADGGTFLYFAAAYNMGGGALQQATKTDKTLSAVPSTVQSYVKNVYSLINSGFTKGDGGYPDPKSSSAGPPNQPTSTQKTVVALDPGHAGANTVEVDPDSKIISADSGGAAGEMQNMWDTAQLIKARLEKDGYSVVLTKNSENDTAGLVTKANRANQSHAAIAVSLHYTGGANFGTANHHYGVTPQEVGRFRQNKSDGVRKTFTDANLAQKSLQYAQIMATERTKTGDTANVAPLDESFPQSRPDVQAFGDISIVQLLGQVPWVYNETGANGFDKQKYADGITNGIEKAIPSTNAGTPDNSCSSGVVAGSVAKTAINLAWPGPHQPPTEPKPEYTDALQQFNPGGGKGIDCGVFVSTVMRASGVDPNYPVSYTPTQEAYVRSHPDKYLILENVQTTGDLKAGDILIVNDPTGGGGSKGHTLIFVDNQPGGYNEASASLNERAPNLGTIASLVDRRGHYLVARLK